MDIPVGLESLFWIVLAAALAPLIVGLLPGPKVPEVVVLLLLGIVIGPEVLGLATKEGPILLLNDVGLGFLFFIAGYELNPRVLKGRTGVQAAASWAVSMALALSRPRVLLSQHCKGAPDRAASAIVTRFRSPPLTPRT